MGLKLVPEQLDVVCMLVKDYMKEGKTLERFLTDFELSKRKWDKFLRSNKALQNAVEDGLVFYKAFWQSRLDKAMFQKKANSTLAKMAFENALGWTVEAAKREKNVEPKRMYKVILDLGEEDEPIEEEDKYYPKLGKTQSEIDAIFKGKENED